MFIGIWRAIVTYFSPGRIGWKILFAITVFLIISVFAAAIYASEQFQFAWLTQLRTSLADSYFAGFLNIIDAIAQNDALYSISIGGLFIFASVATIQIFKIPDIRNTAIQAIAWGYYENFLSKVVEKFSKDHKDFRIIIILPSYELVERPNFYYARLQVEVQKAGFQIKQENLKEEFGRTTYSIYTEHNLLLPIALDLPSTLKVVRRILELEAHTPAGRVARQKWWRTRFKELRQEFRESLVDFFGDEGWANVVFLDGDNSKQFGEDLVALVKEFEDSQVKSPGEGV